MCLDVARVEMMYIMTVGSACVIWTVKIQGRMKGMDKSSQKVEVLNTSSRKQALQNEGSKIPHSSGRPCFRRPKSSANAPSGAEISNHAAGL